MEFNVETLPPQDIRAEQSVIGSCITNTKALEACLEVLEVEHFHRRAHALMWRCIRALHIRGEAIDSVTVTQELRRAEFEEAAGSIDYVQECIDVTPTSANAAHYARIVREKWLRRQVILLANEMQAGAYDDGATVSDVISSVTARAIALQMREDEAGSLEHVSRVMRDFQERVSRSPLRDSSRVETGIRPLDDTIGGFQDSDLHYWGGAPGSGKTTLAMQVAYNIASSERMAVFFSMELGPTQFARRLTSFASRVEGRVIEFGPLTEWKMMLPRVENGIRQVSNLPLHVSFGRLSTPQIITRLRQAIALEKRKPSVVFIDRLEMLADSDCAALEETKRIPILSARVKGIATTLDVPVVCLCQLNRAGREGTPTGESFRASGAIEQDCQVGLIVKTDKAAHISTLYVVKQNDGQTGACEVLHFDARLPMFLEVAR